MKALIFFTLIILTNSSVLFAQSGYFGRKVMVEIGALGRIPMVYNRLGSEPNYYKEMNGSLRKTTNKFDFGFLGGVSLLSKKSVSFALYGGIYTTESKGLSSADYASFPINDLFINVQKMESFKLRTINIQPTLIISNERFTKPAGLSHEIGFGYQSTNLITKDYLVVAEDPSNQQEIDENKSVIYNKEAKYKAIGLTYTLKIKQPLSDRLFLSYGLRYNLTIGNFNDIDSHKIMSYSSSQQNNDANVRKSLNQQYVNLFAGLAFML